MDKLSVMNAFCRIVQRGSFSRAAEDVGVSPALLSREIKLLEDSLGTTLLNRTTRRMSLTDSGAQYFEEARDILDRVTRFEERIRDDAGDMRGHLKINASSSLGQTVITPFLPSFLKAYPDLRVSLNLNDRVLDPVEGGFDISIRIHTTLPDSNLIARKIGTMGQAVFAAPDYLKSAPPLTHPDDVSAHRVIGFLLADHLTTWAMSSDSEEVTLQLDPLVRVGSSLVLRDLLIAGQGIGTLPNFISAPSVARGELARVLPEFSLPSRDIYAVSPSRHGINNKANAFIEHLSTALSSL